jgi:hypothetical protein
MKDNSLARVGGFSSLIVGVLSVFYAVAYLFITPAAQRGADVGAFFSSFATDPTGRQLANLCFLFSGVLGTFTIAAVSERLRPLSAGWSRWALVVGMMALVATGIHGFYNFVVTPIQANLYNSGDTATRAAIAVAHSMPLPTDPAEFFTFGMTGLWALVVGLQILHGREIPRWVGYVALIAGVDMLLLFCADLAGAGTLVLLTGGPAALILGPAMWIGIGLTLLRGARATATSRSELRASGA